MLKKPKLLLYKISLLLSLLLVCNVGWSQIHFSTDDIDVVDIGALIGMPTGANQKTIAIWVNLDSFGSDTDDVIFDHGYGGSVGEGLWIYAEENSISVGFSGHRVIIQEGNLATGVWYHFVVVVPTGLVDTDDVLYYLNGVLETPALEAGAAKTLNLTTVDIHFGSDSEVAGGMDGKVGELEIWAIALTAEEIAQQYNSWKKRFPLQLQPSSLKGYWPLDDYAEGISINGKTFIELTGNDAPAIGVDADGDSLTSANTILSYPPD